MTDITRIKQDLAKRAKDVAEQLLPGGMKHGNEWRAGSLDGEKGQSLGVHLQGAKAGVWCDFQTGATGDLIDLWAQVRRVPLSEALRQISDYLGIIRPKAAFQAKTDYTRPPRPKCVAPQGKVRDYLTEIRNIPPSALDAYKIGERGDMIVFPFLLPGGELAMVKERKAEDGAKPKPTTSNCEPVLFGWQAIPENARDIVITEGECLLGSAEVLTPNGWVSLESYQGGSVAQWKDDAIEWVFPTAKIDKPFCGEMLEFTDRFVSMTVTPGHRMPGLDALGRLRILTAEQREVGNRHHILPRTGAMAGPGIGLTSDQIALCLAVSADAAIDVRKKTFATGRIAAQDRYARITVFKARKQERLAALLARLNIPHCRTENVGNSRRKDGMFFGVPMPDWIPGRILPWEWVANATADEREFILSELRHWDGNEVRNRNQHEFSTIHQQNADWVQAICHTSGRCSTIMPRKNAFGEWLKVSILHGKSAGTYQQLKPKRIHHSGRVYCLTVPSGMFLAREKGRVFVTGNCDALSWFAYGFPALSVPFGGGGGAKQQWIENDFERMERFEKIYIATDMDKPGDEAAAEIASRLGRHRCYRVSMPLKDANACLMDGIPKATMAAAIAGAASLDPEGLRRPSDFVKDVTELFWPVEGVVSGYRTPYGKLGDKLLFRPGEVTIWTGATGAGKSQVLSDCTVDWIKQGSRICLSSLEMKCKQTLRRMTKQVAGVGQPTPPFIDTSLRWLSQGLLVYDKIGKASVKDMLDVFEFARRKYGCDQFILDSLMRLGIASDDYVGQETAVFNMVDWAVESDIHLHIVAHARKGTLGQGAPETEDVKGASEIGSNAFNVISIWRNRQLEDDINKLEMQRQHEQAEKLRETPGVLFNIGKQRNGDYEGKIGLWFDQDSYRYYSSHERQSSCRQYLDITEHRTVAA